MSTVPRSRMTAVCPSGLPLPLPPARTHEEIPWGRGCDLCGDKLPVQFLVAAHVKKRSVCSTGERLDIPAIAMVACKFGCDALYEEGYLAVDYQGLIVVSPLAPKQGAAAGYLARLNGRVTPAFNPARAAYFGWHHGHTYKR